MPTEGEGLAALGALIRYLNGETQSDLGLTPGTRQQFEALSVGNTTLRCDYGHRTQLGRSEAIRKDRKARAGLGEVSI